MDAPQEAGKIAVLHPAVGFCNTFRETRWRFLENKRDAVGKPLLEIAPIEKDPDHDSQQTGCHTDQIGRHNAETGPKPPADPAKNGNTQKKNNFFHINSTKSPTGKRTCETPGAGTKPALGFTP